MNIQFIIGILLMFVGILVMLLSLRGRTNGSTGVILIGPIPIIIRNNNYLPIFMFVIFIMILIILLLGIGVVR